MGCAHQLANNLRLAAVAQLQQCLELRIGIRVPGPVWIIAHRMEAIKEGRQQGEQGRLARLILSEHDNQSGL